MNKYNEGKANEFIEFFRSLDSSERDSIFEKIKDEYIEIKGMEKMGFMPGEQKYKDYDLEEARVSEAEKAHQEALESALNSFELGFGDRGDMSIIVKEYDGYLQKLAQEYNLDSQTKERIDTIHDIIKTKDYEGVSNEEFKNFTKTTLDFYRDLSADIQQNKFNEKSQDDSVLSKMKQKITAFAEKSFGKENKKENDLER